jgi:hypothetical protein
MLIRLSLGLLLAGALALSQGLEAATTTKKTPTPTAKKAATTTTKASPTAKKAATTAKGSSGQLRKTGDGPLGAFVAAPDQQVFANILGFLYGMPTIGYERALGADNSWTAQLGFRSQGASNFSVNYLGVVGSYRWWVGEHAKMQGVYVGPLGTLQMVNINYDATTINGFTVTTKKESANSFIFGIGAEGGYQWILPASFTFSAGLNMGYYFGSLNLGSGAPSIPFGGFGAGLNGTVGYAF